MTIEPAPAQPHTRSMTGPTTTTRFRRRATSVIAGALLLLLVAQPALAVEWGSTARLSSLETYRPRIFRTGPSSALTVYQRGTNAYARRSVDSGKTWSAPVKIASAIRLNFSAAGYGSKVDIAYVRQVTTSTGTHRTVSTTVEASMVVPPGRPPGR